MAEELDRSDGWGIFDRLKNLPHVITVKGDLKRTPCKTSLQSEIDDEESDVQKMPAPQEHQGVQLTNDLIVDQNEAGERGEEPENDGALSNRELLNQLHAVAVGIRDFEVLGAKPKLTEVVGEVKDKRVSPTKSTSDNSTKSKAKESSEKKLSAPKNSSSKATSKAILKAASKVRTGVIVKSKAREKLAFSDSYLKTAFGLSNITRLSEKLNVSISAKKSTSATNESPAKKPFKAKTLTTKQPTLLSTGGELNLAKKEARQREPGWDSEDKLPIKKKAKVSPKSVVQQRLRVLPHERRVLPEAALAEVVSAKAEQELAETEMAKFVDEIRVTKNDNFNDLPPDVTERWIAVRAKKLRNSLNFHSTIIRHTLASVTPKVGP